jgi:hypothetical protein
MVQNGIAFAAGQLLAVVAPRTVLVVDAPTDWSLAGPLWELALDDAPVDEILDVLIRRGIRTAPSFAIVRVEADAVRALVRGSVPVCFERVGEPVRLDATGATTWLEGLISGARRVLVGAVEANHELPYLVSTGVVLVSGLALPCAPAEPENRQIGAGPEAAEPSSASDPGDAQAEEEPYFSPPAPVSAGASGANRFAPIASREPRVVDLTRGESPSVPALAEASLTAAPESRESRESWERSTALSSPEVNGHSEVNGHPEMNGHSEVNGNSEVNGHSEINGRGPAVLEPQPAVEPESAPEPESAQDFGGPPPVEAPSSYRAPAAFQASAPNAYQAPSLFARPSPTNRAGDDPGELQDLDDDSTAPPAAAAGSVYEAGYPDHRSQAHSQDVVERGAQQYANPVVYVDDAHQDDDSDDVDQVDQDDDWHSDDDRDSEPRAATPPEDPDDDLLIESADDEAAPGPAPTDLPRFEAPAVALPVPSANGSGLNLPAQPRGFGGVPAGWPPLRSSGTPEVEAPAAPRSMFTASPFSAPPKQAAEAKADPSPSVPAADEQAEPIQEPVQPRLGELPLRVRGRSLRPEQSAPFEGRLLGGPPSSPPPSPAPPSSSIPPLRSLHEGDPFPNGSDGRDSASSSRADRARSGDDGQLADSSQASGGLSLPAFFRGSRSARNSGPAEVSAPVAREGNDSPPPSGPMPWGQNGSTGVPPSAWVPPVRRGLPEGSGFNGGPPAMPEVLRPPNFDSGDGSAADEQIERSTESTPPPTETPSGGIEAEQAYEPPREPPRVLAVWCDAGHVTAPKVSQCRVCGLDVPRQTPILVARPPLGFLIFDNGDRVEVDRPVILGRDPKAVSSPDPEEPVLHAVTSSTGQVSRTHAEIRADGWDVVLTDLDAMNGTALTLPGSSPMAIEPGVPTLISAGTRVDLGGESGFVFEIEG